MRVCRDGRLHRARTGVRRPRERAIEGEPGELVSLFALHGPAQDVRTEGLTYSLDGETLEPGSTRGVSNVLLEERASVSVGSGVLLAVCPREGAKPTRCHKGALVALLAAVLLAAAGCGGDGPPTDVVLLTHDSFAVSKPSCKKFERDTGLGFKFLKAGDAGEVVTKAALTAGNPQGDVLFGVDNTLLSRALDADVFEPYESPSLERVDPEHILDPNKRHSRRSRRGLPQLRPGTWSPKRAASHRPARSRR